MTAEWVEVLPGASVEKGAREVVIGLRRHYSEAQVDEMRERCRELLPDTKVLFVCDAQFAFGVGDSPLCVAAVRLHEAMYRADVEWLDNAPDDVTVAYGDLQQALKRLGWSPC